MQILSQVLKRNRWQRNITSTGQARSACCPNMVQVSSTGMTAELNAPRRVDREIGNNPVDASIARKGVNHSMYAKRVGKLYSLHRSRRGSGKMTWICTARKPDDDPEFSFHALYNELSTCLKVEYWQCSRSVLSLK